MILKSFSKINLSINVSRKLKNGLHDIQSYFCLIDVFDEIRIVKNNKKKDLIIFKGKFAKNIQKTSNSVSKTLKILRNKKVISDYYSIIIKKKIPVYGGLGGGTSNAACLIKYFTKGRVNKNLFIDLEKIIGSDLRLFFYNQGYLKNLKKIKKITKHNLNFLLVFPNIKCPTKKIYSKVNKFSKKSKFIKTGSKKKFINFLIQENNDLQSIVENKHPFIRNLINEISAENGCYFSRMTGSGSVCYGVFRSDKSAKLALKKIKYNHPNYWLTVAKTI